MSSKNNVFQYRRILKRIGAMIAGHALYGNILLGFAVGVWLYIFITDYYIAPKEDFSFVASKSSEIYDVTLDQKALNDVYRRYRNKQTMDSGVPSSVKGPF